VGQRPTERAGRGRLPEGAQLVGWRRWHLAANHRPMLPFEDRRLMTAPAVRVFRGISRAWEMSFREELGVVGLPRPVWSSCARDRAPVLPAEALMRIVLVARVFEAVNVLFPPERADAWMRSPNSARIFGGQSALDLMVGEGRTGIRAVRMYLLGEIYG